MNDRHLDFFKKVIEKDRLSHLYILCGERGSGKTELALSVSYEILRQGKEDENLKSQVFDKQYPNLFFIEPEKDAVKKEQILELQEEFNKTSLINKPRIYIIKHVDKMTTAAANSLLKFMEDPVSSSTFGFLLTEQKENVLPTIISRSQVINLESQTYEFISEELKSKGVPLKSSKVIPLLTKDIDEAISFSEDVDVLELIDLITGFIEIWNSNKSIVLFLNDRSLFYKDRKWFEYFLNMLVILFVDIVHIKINHEITFDFLQDEISLMSTKISLEKANDIIDFLQEAISQNRYYIGIELAITNVSMNLQKRR